MNEIKMEIDVNITNQASQLIIQIKSIKHQEEHYFYYRYLKHPKKKS